MEQHLAKFFKRIILASLYLPIIIYIVFKLSYLFNRIFLINFNYRVK